MTHTKDYWIGVLAEASFAGGAGGGAYNETEPVNTGALTESNFPFNTKQKLPALEHEQEALEGAGQDISEKMTFAKGIDMIPGKKSQYVQSEDWITRAIAGVGGAVPTGSWCEVFKNGQALRSAYGCYITTYKLNIPLPSSFPKEDIDYQIYEVKTLTTPANFITAKAWSTTAAKKHKDFSLSIGGSSLDVFDTATLTITKKYSEKSTALLAGLHRYPYLHKIDFELEVETEQYISTLYDDLESATMTAVTAIIVGWGKTLTVTNLKVKPKTLDHWDLPEKGVVKYHFTLEIGGASTLTLA